MQRREFITLLGGAAVAWPLAAGAQSALPVVGFLCAVSPDGYMDRVHAFRQGLKDAGYVEGENVSVEYRWAENQLDRLPGLAADLVRRGVAVIVAIGGTAPALAAKAATRTIPIVFTVPEDPVKLGLVASLSRPGSNLTGVNFFLGELLAKRLELMRELVPGARRIAFLVNPANPERADVAVKEVQAAAQVMGMKADIFKTGSASEINAAFEMFEHDRPDALFVQPDPFFPARRVQLANLASRHALPSSFSVRDIVEAHTAADNQLALLQPLDGARRQADEMVEHDRVRVFDPIN
jgi:putative ABC transport system substrate-binding protein